MSLTAAFCRNACRPLSSVARPAVWCIMPLRAKILWRSESTNHEPREGKEKMPVAVFNSNLYSKLRLEEHPDDEPDDVVFGATQGVRTIHLNRPKKLNSLNGSMARKIIPRLIEWEKSQMANVIVISGEGRAFCAGGDVGVLARQNNTKEGRERSKEYFALEYRLDHLIATTTKPYVAFMDGITMGGGVGLSVHAPFRIATENTVFAMPETTIGFFPDVGASFFLPRMDGQMGMYLALTSEQLKGVDLFFLGIATHYIHSTSLPALQARLAELQFPDHMDLPDRNTIIASTMDEFTSTLPSPRPSMPAAIRNLIDQIFALDSIPSILHALESHASNPDPTIAKWAASTKATIETRSPTSVLVTFRMLRASEDWSIAEAFQREYTLASVFMSHNDFTEGIDAKLVRRSKDRPKWKPNTLADALGPHALRQLDDFFPVKAPERLELLRSGAGAAFEDYPHQPLALPREDEILASLQHEEIDGDPRKCVERWVFEWDGKVGVKEKVEDVLERFALREMEKGEEGERGEKEDEGS